MKPSEQLRGGDKDSWQACVQLLTDAGIDAEQAEQALARGFGWTDRYYWQGDIVDQVPTKEQVRNPSCHEPIAHS